MTRLSDAKTSERSEERLGLAGLAVACGGGDGVATRRPNTGVRRGAARRRDAPTGLDTVTVREFTFAGSGSGHQLHARRLPRLDSSTS